MSYDAVELEILSSRLISIVEEAAATLLRTCYSAVVREARDFTCTMTDAHGELLAQAPHSLPAFAATMPRTVRACLEEFPLDTLNEGDVLVTNNPWLAIGHLPDIVVITPVWRKRRVIAFAANAANVADIGGRAMGAAHKSIYEEGIQIPIVKLYAGGKPRQDIFKFIQLNVRMSEQVVGDVRAQVASNEVCARRLVEFMDEAGLDDLGPLASAIQDRSEQAMRRAIAEIPDGTYGHTAFTRGYDSEVRIQVAITVKGDEILCDFAGSSNQVPWAINSVLNYTFAYAAYTIKCVVAPHIPNNEGCFRPITVTAPPRSIVNPSYPAPVAARSQVGKFLPIPVMCALAQAVPGKVIADSGSAPLWCPRFTRVDESTGREVKHSTMLTGGLGARPALDGISAIDFPSVIVNVPVEMHEVRFPMLFRRWNLIPDSGGAGTRRGGMGFDLEVENISGGTMSAMLRCERTDHPAQGVNGGFPGSVGRVGRGDGTALHPHGTHPFPPGTSILFSTAGGGGFGDPRKREPERVLDDVRDGWVSLEAARDLYGVVIDPADWTVDKNATSKLRMNQVEAAK
jgi:N-methylhydantoinase B